MYRVAHEVTHPHSDTTLVFRAASPISLASVLVKEPTSTSTSYKAQGFPSSRRFIPPHVSRDFSSSFNANHFAL